MTAKYSLPLAVKFNLGKRRKRTRGHGDRGTRKILLPCPYICASSHLLLSPRHPTLLLTETLCERERFQRTGGASDATASLPLTLTDSTESRATPVDGSPSIPTSSPRHRVAASSYLGMFFQPTVNVTQYELGNFPREKVGSIGVAFPLAIVEVSSCF